MNIIILTALLLMSSMASAASIPSKLPVFLASSQALESTKHRSFLLLKSENGHFYNLFVYNAEIYKDKREQIFQVTESRTVASIATECNKIPVICDVDESGASGIALLRDDIVPQVGHTDATQVYMAQHADNYRKYRSRSMRFESESQQFLLYASINGQSTLKNLDTSGILNYEERLMDSQGRPYADRGYLLNLEARMRLYEVSQLVIAEVQLICFVDSGAFTLNKNTWADGLNRQNVSGAGVGMSWIEENTFELKAYFANKLSTQAAPTIADEAWRFWIQGIKYF